jgi:SAM-dependent methyltransferase
MKAMPQSPVVFDHSLVRARQRRASALGAATFLIDRVADEIGERLSAVVRKFERAADIGTPTDALRRAVGGSGQVGAIAAVEATGENEALSLAPASLDLAVSALALQYANDLPGVLAQIRRALKPDGLFLAALAGGDTLTELRDAFAAAESEIEGGISPRVAPFADVRDLGALLQRAGFALPVVDSDRLVVRYGDVFALMNDLRRMGATNALAERRRVPLRRVTLKRMAEIYAQRFSDGDGRVRATFEVIWLSGWAPDASQQQPLKPGSARHRLADALGTVEISAEEKPGRSGRS